MITPSNLGMNPSSCQSTTSLQQNLQGAANGLQNLQQQIGDLNQLINNPAPNGSSDIASILQGLQDQITALQAAGGGGGGGVLAYGGMTLETETTLTTSVGDTAFYRIPFDTAMSPSSGVTITTGASAKATVANSGVYYVSFSGFGEEDGSGVGTAAGSKTRIEWRLRLNASGYTTPFVSSGQVTNNIGLDGINYQGNDANGSFCGIFSLTAGDYLWVDARVIMLAFGAYVTDTGAGTRQVFKSSDLTMAGVAGRVYNSQLSVMRIA